MVILQVYRGDFDDQSAVDVNIKGMASETMAFPLRYGYCLVRATTTDDATREGGGLEVSEPAWTTSTALPT